MGLIFPDEEEGRLKWIYLDDGKNNLQMTMSVKIGGKKFPGTEQVEVVYL